MTATVVLAGEDAQVAAGAPILVYDGECAFCARSVQFLLAHDRRQRTVRFAARQGEAGRAVRERHPHLAQVDSLIWVIRSDGTERPLVRSDALLAITGYLGGGWALLGLLGRLVPRPLREAGYALVARSRRRLSRGREACVVFTPEQRARVLD